MNVVSNIIDSNHGFVGDAIDYYEKKEYHAIVLSGGGIDSFMSTIAYMSQRTKGFFPDCEEYTKQYGVKDSEAVPTIKFKLTFLMINYGQASFEAEEVMTKNQADWFKNQSTAYWDIQTDIIVLKDPLVHHIRNPLGDRDKAKDDAKTAGMVYSANDDYVPNRNARFVFTAAGLAESIGADTIILGAVGNVNQDNSLAFIKAAHETIKQSNRDNFPAIYAPFVLLTKSMVALYAEEKEVLDIIANTTTSCFDVSRTERTGGGDDFVTQCGVCRSCVSLKQAFKFAGVSDPYYYEQNRPKIPAFKAFGTSSYPVSSNVEFTGCIPVQINQDGTVSPVDKPSTTVSEGGHND